MSYELREVWHSVLCEMWIAWVRPEEEEKSPLSPPRRVSPSAYGQEKKVFFFFFLEYKNVDKKDDGEE